MLPWILSVGFSAICIVLLIQNMRLKRSMDEIREAFKARLAGDTNTLISLSAGDPHAKRLAGEINAQLYLLRKQRRQYLSGDRALKEAVTNISHDLRTPLTAICGYLDLMEGEEKSEAAARYVSYITNRAEAMKQLTEELFRYTIVRSTQDDLRPETVSINTILEDSMAAFYPHLSKRNITPNIDMPQRHVMCFLDKTAVSRVFSNILDNVLNYSDGDLDVRLLDRGEVFFTNAAAGLDEVQVGKLFNRYFTVEAARNSTGLGLAISKELVEQMGGTISAQYINGRLRIRIAFPSIFHGQASAH